MSSVSLKITKRLFAISGNRCAFPKCTVELVDRPSGKVVGRISHICAASKNGPRYNPSQTNEERNGYENLLLLCPVHHDVVDDDEISYTVERLLKMKSEWEAEGAKAKPLDISDDLAKVVVEISEKMGNVEGLALRLISQVNAQPTLPQSNNKEGAKQEAVKEMMKLWKLFNTGYGRLINLTSPIQEFANLSLMDEVQFEEWLDQSELTASSKESLRSARDRTEEYSKIRVWIQLNKATVACAEFHNALTDARPLLSDEVKRAFITIDEVMYKALSQMKVALEAKDYQMRATASTLAFSIQGEIPKLEELIHEALF